MSKLLFIGSMLVPYIVEVYLRQTCCTGNMALNGVWLDIYYKRNTFYLSLIILFLSYILNYVYYGSILVFISLCLYINTCNKWYKYLVK